MVRNELTVIIKSVIGERNHRWYIVAAIRPAGTNAKRNTTSVMRNVSYVSFPGTRVLFLDFIAAENAANQKPCCSSPSPS